MTTDPLLLGIDVGTSGVRAGLFTPDGQLVSSKAVDLPTDFPLPGYAEQDPKDWWNGVVTCVKGALEGQDAGRVAGIGVDATAATVMACTNDGTPLRPGIMWMDVRSHKQARKLTKTGDPALKYSGHGAVSAELGTPKLMWLKKHEPEVWDRTDVLVDCSDWVVFRLTGEWTMSICHATFKYFYDPNWGGWPTSLYEAGKIPDALDKFPKRVLNLGEVAGTLSPAVASELGLPAGVPVSVGGIDAHVGAIGLGIVQPGSMALITGSSHVMLGQTDAAIYTQGIWGACYDAIIPGQYTVEAGQVSTGSVLRWFASQFAMKANAGVAAGDGNIYQLLDEMAKDIPIGSDGIVMLDHFQGNRSPFFDAKSRGVIAGLGLGHTEGHIYRAILESVAYGTLTIFDVLTKHGFAPEHVVVSGGPTKSKLWMQIHADVAGVPMTLPKQTEGPLLGSAILGGVAGGVYKDAIDGAKQAVQIDKVIEPNLAATEEYHFWWKRYLDIYQATAPSLHAMVDRTLASKK